MAEFVQKPKYNYFWQNSKFANVSFSGSLISQFVNDKGYLTAQDIPATSGSTDTGSLLITASFSTPNLEFEKGNGSGFALNLSSLVVTNAYTASYINGGTF